MSKDLRDKLISIAKGALIAASGAAGAYAVTHLGGVDLGVWTPLFVAGLSAAINAVRKFLEPAQTPDNGAFPRLVKDE